MQRRQPLVSIVTPVYNAQKYLAECIESVLVQSYENWEYVLVNNCSKDGSLAIAREYSARDPRIRVVDNEVFLTSLQNFNHMLRQISPESKYCKIVHADDWLFPSCVSEMVELAEANPSVGIVGSYRLVGERVESDGLPHGRSVIPGAEVARMNLLDGPYTFGTPSALLIRSDLIRSRPNFYNESHTGADTEVCLELLQSCDFGFVFQVLSFSREHDGSVTSKNQYFNTSHPNFLRVFQQYGPVYLEESVYRQRLRRQLRDYYRFLGSNPRRLWDRRFRAYHAEALSSLGFPFSWWRLTRAAAFAAARELIDIRRNLRFLAKVPSTILRAEVSK